MTEQEWLAKADYALSAIMTVLGQIWVDAPFTGTPEVAQIYHLFTDISQDCHSLRRRINRAISDMEAPCQPST